MGNFASVYTPAVAKVAISKVSQAHTAAAEVRNGLGIGPVNEQRVATDHESHNDQLIHTSPPTGGTSSSTNAKLEDVIQNLNARPDHDVHPPPTNPDRTCCAAAGSLSEPTSASEGADLHDLTRNLKRNTELVKDTIYELLKERRPDAEFVFFHGLQPDNADIDHAFWRTWKMRSSEECWLTSLLPQIVNCSSRIIRPRVLSVSYQRSSKRLWGFRASPIDQFSTPEDLMMDLIGDDDIAVGQQFLIPVILVGHDLGGIMIRKLLMKMKKILAAKNAAPYILRNLERFNRNLGALVFYATPEVGYSKIDDKIPANSQSPSLQFLRAVNQETARVNKDFEKSSFKIPTLRISESAKTDQGNYHKEFVIPTNVSGEQSHNEYVAPWEDHFQVCQPTGVHSTTARRFARFVVDLIDELREDEDFV